MELEALVEQNFDPAPETFYLDFGKAGSLCGDGIRSEDLARVLAC
jgi:hypothetical protein